jgi:hypothetical protein
MELNDYIIIIIIIIISNRRDAEIRKLSSMKGVSQSVYYVQIIGYLTKQISLFLVLNM